MTGPIASYMTADHRRLEELRRAGDFWAFRGGLLRHIGLEEKLLLPALKRAHGAPFRDAARLREDHGALATLLVPQPSPALSDAIEQILAPHDRIEEAPDGLYAACDALPEAEELAGKLRAAPEISQNDYQDGPRVRAQIERVLAWLAARK
jgi:hypothetical protein